MNKSMYSDDIIWYDQGVYNAIEALAAQYDNAIPVFGGALGAYEYVNSDTPNFSKFVGCLCHVIKNAKFYHWHEGAVGAIRRFCRLCLVDPALIECYLGMSLNELCSEV